VQSPKQAKPGNQRIEKDLLTAAGKGSPGVISKCPTQTKEVWGFYLGSLYIFT
jgi:hypothetical protein